MDIREVISARYPAVWSVSTELCKDKAEQIVKGLQYRYNCRADDQFRRAFSRSTTDAEYVDELCESAKITLISESMTALTLLYTRDEAVELCRLLCKANGSIKTRSDDIYMDAEEFSRNWDKNHPDEESIEWWDATV